MEKITLTERLRCTLIENIELGSEQLETIHFMRSDPAATSWSLLGPSKSLEDTIKIAKRMIPNLESQGQDRYRAQFAVYDRFSADQKPGVHGVIGLVGVFPPNIYPKALPDHLTLPDKDAAARSLLKMEIGYMFLQKAWGKGYATEAVRGLLQACKMATSFFEPYKAVYLHVTMGEDNLASANVARKAGFEYLGIHEWEGENHFLGGAWRRPRVHVFGMLLQLNPDDVAKKSSVDI